MKKYYHLLLVLGITSASLSSCSRSSYSFNTKAPAYLGSEQVRVAQPAATEDETAMASASADAALPVATVAASAHQAARTLAQRAPAPVAAKAAVATLAAASTEASQPTKFNRKAFKKEVKQQLAAAPQSTTAEGKSQVVAAILNFFLGFLGIHRFYLGYVGIGILELLTFGVFGILSLIDFIRILIGDLKPKDGEYAKKF